MLHSPTNEAKCFCAVNLTSDAGLIATVKSAILTVESEVKLAP